MDPPFQSSVLEPRDARFRRKDCFRKPNYPWEKGNLLYLQKTSNFFFSETKISDSWLKQFCIDFRRTGNNYL
jgi:hypothetical protein